MAVEQQERAQKCEARVIETGLFLVTIISICLYFCKNIVMANVSVEEKTK